MQAQLADTQPTQARPTTHPAKSAPPNTPLSTADEELGGGDHLPPCSPSLSEPPPASALKPKAAGGAGRGASAKQRLTNVKVGAGSWFVVSVMYSFYVDWASRCQQHSCMMVLRW
jgi:hypothetical protein